MCFWSTAIMMPAPKRYLRAAPRYPANASRHRIKIRSRSPFLRAVPGCRFFMRFAVSGRLCRVILTGERHERGRLRIRKIKHASG
ncbi:hypothetical protein CO326_25255 [Salmonella enterica]|nr:hypothetical protein [Salmonella enterica]